MRLQNGSFGFLLAFLIALSFAALIQLQTDAVHGFSEKNAALVQIDEISDSVTALCPIQYSNLICNQNISQFNSTRVAINTFIAKNPGVDFRGVCTGLGLAIGTVQFHIQVMEKQGGICFVRDGKHKRFFKSNTFTEKEITLLSVLRHKTAKKVLNAIAENDGKTNHTTIASNLNITSQALTWQIHQLKNHGIIEAHNNKTQTTYTINPAYQQLLPQLLKANFP
ncbi:MAG: winged helix-turn-helix transcriptional regulator [Candidatus Bathyarchaeota archaeon]|nr:winged helix-turn-helix transcriptional regulator [Candidatus Bathyarchaeota archaeon]